MGVVRTLNWTMLVDEAEARDRVLEALTAIDVESQTDWPIVRGRSKRAMRKNRWAAELEFEFAPGDAPGRSVVRCSVDMLGDKHFAILDELAEHMGDELFDDGGVAAAVARLDKTSRLFGRKEIRHLRVLVQPGEMVEALAQGQFAKKQGILVLTDKRLFFFEKSLGSETLEEFPMGSVSSLRMEKKLTGERLVIHASGNDAEITHVAHGQADDLVNRFRNLKSRPVAAQPAPASAAQTQSDVLDQIRKLGELRDAGVLTDQEFDTKKADLLSRL